VRVGGDFDGTGDLWHGLVNIPGIVDEYLLLV